MEAILSGAAFVVLYGASYGFVLFTISIGMVITMGLMRVMNLAHGSFAAIGGYATIALMNKLGLPFLPALGCAIAFVAVLGILLEKVVFTHLYHAPDLDQVLMTLGLNFVVIAALSLIFGPNLFPMTQPAFLRGSIDLGFRSIEIYRLFVVGVGAAIAAFVYFGFEKSMFGARLRAAVDNRGMAEATGINVDVLFSLSFAIGGGLAALGGGVGAGMLPLEPFYPLKYLVLVLIVVALSGGGNVRGALGAAIFTGIVDTAGRFLLPEVGGFVMYVLLIALVVWRGEGLFVRRTAT
jgi:branched-chain amino acid transport system permease protein